ncbi:hypothetical protein AB4496_11835, partial [Vibrio sp. 10N.222.46.A1]
MNNSSQSSLLTQKRFLPYFITQFLGAFNDNIFKNVLLLFVAFASVDTLPISSNLFINLAAGLFILPFFLFSALAGVLADKHIQDKTLDELNMVYGTKVGGLEAVLGGLDSSKLK